MGNYFFDVNSTIAYPKVLADSEVVGTLEQLRSKGYSVYVVRGNYPSTRLEEDPAALRAAIDACRAADGDFLAGARKSGQGAGPAFRAFEGAGNSLKPKAAPMPMAEVEVIAAEDPELAAALAASMEDMKTAPAPATRSAAEEAEEMRRMRLARFG